MSDRTSAFSGGDLLSSLAGVAVDAVVGRLARSDESVSTYAELKSAVEAVLPTEKAIIKVTKNITWPNYKAGANNEPCESSMGVRVGLGVGQMCGRRGIRERRARLESCETGSLTNAVAHRVRTIPDRHDPGPGWR